MTTDGTPGWARALVTGASSGIGRAFAVELAASGSNLVIVARSEDKLGELASALSERHGAEVEILPADLTSESDVSRVQERLRATGKPVDCLVNNAGFGWHGDFVDQDQTDADAQIQLNVRTLVDLAHAVVPGLVARGHGGVLNVASIGGHVPSPGFAVYSATKAFVVSFSESLHHELRDSGVHVTVLSPGLTRTGFQERADVSLPELPQMAWSTPEEVARAGLSGLAENRTRVVPGVLNRVMVASSGLMPRGLSARLAERLLPPED